MNKKIFSAVMLLLGLSGVSFSAGSAVLAGMAVPAARMPAVPAPEAVKSGKEAWKHIRLAATDGTVITIDYSVLDLVGSVIAAPVWVNVEGVNPVSVRVVLMNYYFFPNGPLSEAVNVQSTFPIRSTRHSTRLISSAGTSVLVSSPART